MGEEKEGRDAGQEEQDAGQEAEAEGGGEEDSENGEGEGDGEGEDGEGDGEDDEGAARTEDEEEEDEEEGKGAIQKLLIKIEKKLQEKYVNDLIKQGAEHVPSLKCPECGKNTIHMEPPISASTRGLIWGMLHAGISAIPFIGAAVAKVTFPMPREQRYVCSNFKCEQGFKKTKVRFKRSPTNPQWLVATHPFHGVCKKNPFRPDL